MTATKFERLIEFLEDNCKNKVPTLENFTSYFRKQVSFEALGIVYDYWLDKRLKRQRAGEKLIHRHKTTTSRKPIRNKKYDPYEAFRPCMEKMHLRKNRLVDRMNYAKMFNLRAQIASDVGKYKKELVESIVRRDILKYRFQNFQNLYQRRDYSGLYLDQLPLIDRDQIVRNIDNKGEAEVVPRREITLESLKRYNFKRKRGVQFHEVSNYSRNKFSKINFRYFQPIANYSYEANEEHQKFNYTNIGLIRSRIGRGGRLIFDRREVIQQNPCPSPEYNEISFYGNISLSKCDNLISSHGEETSSFILKNNDSCCTDTSSLTVDPNNNDYKYEII